MNVDLEDMLPGIKEQSCKSIAVCCVFLCSSSMNWASVFFSGKWDHNNNTHLLGLSSRGIKELNPRKPLKECLAHS